MKKTISKLWLLGPPISLLLVAAALYVKQPWARDMVDTHCPWIKESVGKYAPPFDVVFVGAPETPAAQPQVSAPVIPSRGASPNAAPAVKPFDLQKVFADAALWPKTVVLKRPAEFPAVRNGRVIGSLKVPIGGEARVVKVTNGKVGLEYQGGGAWLVPGDTDFVERAQSAWH